ncbi:MAG: ribokinase, partial [Spirochaetota bacterium]
RGKSWRLWRLWPPGGKGTNQSVALARAGAEVWQAGKIGSDGLFLRELLEAAGANCSRLLQSKVPTGKAIIQVRNDGQNCIIIFGGSNVDISEADMDSFLEGWGPGDAVLLQNEVSNVAYALAECARRGLRVFFNPSPITTDLLALPLEKLACILLNEGEGEALTGERDPELMLRGLRRRCPRTDLVLTLGAEGVRYSGADGKAFAMPARKVKVVDTTGAGDTFTGYFIAALAGGDSPERAIELGTKAAAICVSRKGAASSIPRRDELG